MTVKNPNLVLSCAAVMAAITLSGAPAAAQQRTSELRIQELIREAAQIAAGGQTATPTTAQQGGRTTAPAAGPKVALTLEDAVKLALERNLDIAVQRLNPEISDLAVATAQATYLPNLTSTLLTQGQTQASTNSIAGGAAAQAATNDAANWNGSIAHNLRKDGGAYSVSLTNTRSRATSTVSLYNPS